MTPLFGKGDIVALRAAPNRTGPVIEVLPQIGGEPRYRVFHALGDIRVYHEAQLVAADLTTSGEGLETALVGERWLDASQFRARLTAERLSNPLVDNLYALNAARIQSIPFPIQTRFTVPAC